MDPKEKNLSVPISAFLDFRQCQKLAPPDSVNKMLLIRMYVESRNGKRSFAGWTDASIDPGLTFSDEMRWDRLSHMITPPPPPPSCGSSLRVEQYSPGCEMKPTEQPASGPEPPSAAGCIPVSMGGPSTRAYAGQKCQSQRGDAVPNRMGCVISILSCPVFIPHSRKSCG